MAKVFITRSVPGRPVDLLEQAGHQVEVWPGELPPSRDVLANRLESAAALLTMVTDGIDADLMAAAPGLRIIANMAVGYDNVSPSDANEAGIWLTNTPGVLAETTADLAFALLMDAARNLTASDRDTRAGGWKTWSPTAFLGQDVYRATLGIVGLGEIGEAMARRARGFSMRILYASRTRKPAVESNLGLEWRSFEEVLVSSDFVSLHVPLTPETRHLISHRELALMKPGAILVNTTRGAVVDQDALVASLRSGHLGGAALDVTDPEPLPLDHPLFALPNAVITPHIGSASLATRAKMAEMAALNIIEVLAGRIPLNPVNEPSKPRTA
ncbi:MAG: D-glycerate dehydrogenase [Dehalococcoidia bacterium]|nr:D-glycerate dehydrogenase [Dehalococcoidia bacterium]